MIALTGEQDTLGEGEVVGFECEEARAPPDEPVSPTERLEDSAPAMPVKHQLEFDFAFER